MEIKNIVNDARKRMDSAVEDARKKLATVRTGRASVSLLDGVTVEYYGSEMPLNQVATMHVPEPTMVTVQPFDPNLAIITIPNSRDTYRIGAGIDLINLFQSMSKDQTDRSTK